MALEAFLQVARQDDFEREAARSGEPLFLWDGHTTVFICVWNGEGFQYPFLWDFCLVWFSDFFFQSTTRHGNTLL